MRTYLNPSRMLQPTKRRPNDPVLGAGGGSGSREALSPVGSAGVAPGTPTNRRVSRAP